MGDPETQGSQVPHIAGRGKGKEPESALGTPCLLWTYFYSYSKHGHLTLTMNPDNGAAGGSSNLTLVSPTILYGGASDDQLGPTAFIAQLALCRWLQCPPIFGPVHRAFQRGGFTNKSQVLAFCDCDICEWLREDARLLWGIEKGQRCLGLWFLYERTSVVDHTRPGPVSVCCPKAGARQKCRLCVAPILEEDSTHHIIHKY